jgi:Tol biopolymer transport system component
VEPAGSTSFRPTADRPRGCADACEPAQSGLGSRWAGPGVFSASEDEQPSQLTFVRRRSDSTWEAPHRVTTDGGALPQWSPDGRRIAFITNTRSGLLAQEAAGPVLLIPAADSVRYGVPNMLQWMPDGQRIFYKAFDANGQASI